MLVSLVQLHVDDEVVDVLLCPGELQLAGEHGHDQGGAAGAENARQHGDAAPTVGAGHDVAVAYREEGDGDHPHGVGEVSVHLVVVHLAGAQQPARDDQRRGHEHCQDVLGIQRHHRLEDELEVEVDTIERAQTLRGSIREELAVQHQHTAQQVQAQEHWQGEEHVDRHPRLDYPVVAQDSPDKVVVARDRVDGIGGQLDHDLQYARLGHGQPPVLDRVVAHEQFDVQRVVPDDEAQQRHSRDGDARLDEQRGRVRLAVDVVHDQLRLGHHQNYSHQREEEREVAHHAPPLEELLALGQPVADVVVLPLRLLWAVLRVHGEAAVTTDKRDAGVFHNGRHGNL